MKNALFILAGILAVHLVMMAPPAFADRIIEESISLDGVNRLAVTGHVGKIEVTPEESGKVQLHIKLVPEKGERPDLDAVKLMTDRDGDTLKLELDVPFDEDEMEEKWTIRIPSRMALKLNMGVGDIRVDGINGGLDLDVNVGKIDAIAAEGAVRARTDVGDINVKTSSKSYGRVVVDANVGSTQLTVNGHKVVYDKSPGPGNRVTLDGPGRDSFELQAGVGSAELEIE